MLIFHLACQKRSRIKESGISQTFQYHFEWHLIAILPQTTLFYSLLVISTFWGKRLYWDCMRSVSGAATWALSPHVNGSMSANVTILCARIMPYLWSVESTSITRKPAYFISSVVNDLCMKLKTCQWTFPDTASYVSAWEVIVTNHHLQYNINISETATFSHISKQDVLHCMSLCELLSGNISGKYK